MQIDGRETDVNDLLKQLKDVLGSNRQSNLSVEILVDSADIAKRVSGFVSMSGCNTKIDEKNRCYTVHVRGIPCCT